MPSNKEIEKKFWNQLNDDRTIMLGLVGQTGGGSQPMTAILQDGEPGPVWIFSSKDVDLVQSITATERAVAQFVAKGHDLFATMEGTLSKVNDARMVETLWNPFIAAWYDGKDDPKLQLLRLDLDHAHVWLNENSFVAGIKMLFGKDPKEEYKDKVADLAL